MTEKIVQLDVLRLERHKPRKCTCDSRRFTVDEVNREITCSCGLVVDPFEAMLELADTHERFNRQHKELYEQAQLWKKQKPYSVLFKRLEQDYQRGKMLPYCPHCNYLIELDKLTSWGNAEFYLKRQKEILASKKTD